MSSPAAPAPALLLACLIIAAAPATAGWRELVAQSGPEDDPWLLRALEDADLGERLEILSSLSLRADPAIGAFASRYLGQRSSRHAAEDEYLLRVLLESSFPAGAPSDQLLGRLQANRPVLEEVASRAAAFSDPQLAAAAVRLIPLLANSRPALAAIAERLIGELARGSGLLPPPQTGLLLDALDAMERLADPDFLETALSVARLSREAVVVQRARRVARLLADPLSGR